MPDNHNDMQAVIDAARAGMAATEIHANHRFSRILVPGFGPHASRIETVNLEAGSASPLRKRGAVTVFDAASLKQILADNPSAGHVTIYADRDISSPSIVAVMNGNGPDGPGWGDFTASIKFVATPQWAKWMANDGKLLPQLEFAEFVEDNLEDIASPPGAEMLEIAQELSAKRDLTFRSAVRLHDGRVQLVNVENLQAQIGAGETQVPDSFALGIAPFVGLPTYSVPCRFRYRIENGKLRLGYKMQRVETLMRNIIDSVVANLTMDEWTIVEGLPPAATN